MSFEGPLYVGADTSTFEHTADVLRVSPYAAFGGQEGVIATGDCKVVEGATPGGFVNVLTGAVAVLARGPQQQSQMYVGLSRIQSTVNITPTDSSGSRSDLIIARVEDPYDGSGLWPVDAGTTSYIHARVIEGVPPGTASFQELFAAIGVQSGIALARLDIPPSTSTIDNASVTFVDLRRLASPLREQVQYVAPAPSVEEAVTDVTYIPLPSTGNTTVRVPPWATMMSLDITCKPMRCYDAGGGTDNQMWGQTGVTLNGGGVLISNWWNETFATIYNETWTGVAGEIDVEPYQDQDITLQVVHNVLGGNDQPNQEMQAYGRTATIFRIQFGQRPI